MQIQGIGKEVSIKANSAIENKTDGNDFAAKLEKAANLANDEKENVKLKQVCQEMEAVYLNLMLSKMRATVPKSELFGDSSQEEMLRSMLDSEMTKNLAKAGGIGLADMLYRQLSLENRTKKQSQAPK